MTLSKGAKEQYIHYIPNIHDDAAAQVSTVTVSRTANVNNTLKLIVNDSAHLDEYNYIVSIDYCHHCKPRYIH